jgi:hypothetical protein
LNKILEVLGKNLVGVRGDSPEDIKGYFYIILKEMSW